MSVIKNNPRIKNKIIKAVRGTLEHRALWLYLLLEESEKNGFDGENSAKAAIRRCGCIQGSALREQAGTASLKGLKRKLFTWSARMVFEMKIRCCTDDRLDIDFYHCPLVAAWQAQGASDEKIAELCDIAMEGDRGISSSFGSVLELGKTIAKGDSICEIRFKRIS